MEDITTISNATVTSDEGITCGANYTDDGIITGKFNLPSLLGLLAFYVVIFVAGIIATWKSTGNWFTKNPTEHIVAGRDIGLFLGVLTITATNIGGGFINGTAEYVFTPGYGLLWTQAPFFYALSNALTGIFFAKKMREKSYMTMVDPLEEKYGNFVTAIACIAIAMGDIFWSSAILSALVLHCLYSDIYWMFTAKLDLFHVYHILLGATLSVIIGLNNDLAIIISSAIATVYTLIGGLNSVIYTDVFQLFFIVLGLWLCIPFALTHNAVSSLSVTALGPDGWVGSLQANYWLGLYIDSGLMLSIGGIAWSPLYQRILAQREKQKAEYMCYITTAASIILAIPPVLIGAIAKSTDWNATGYVDVGCLPLQPQQYQLIVPFVLHYLTPTAVSIIGLGAISAAVMSSCDSAILSTSSVFANNMYKPLRNILSGWLGKEQASEREILWILRCVVLVVAVIATVMAISVNSIYGLFFLAGDLNYVFLFPQLVTAVYSTTANSYGSISGTVVSLFIRLTAGEPILKFEPVFKYPWFDVDTGTQLFPFKTLNMLVTLVTIIAVSYLAKFMFEICKLPKQFDIFNCFPEEYNLEAFHTNVGDGHINMVDIKGN